MGKRNIRIFRHQLPERLHELENLEVHVILRNGTTFFGRVKDANPDFIQIQDINARWTSIKKHTHKIPLDDVLEVIFDVVAEY